MSTHSHTLTLGTALCLLLLLLAAPVQADEFTVMEYSDDYPPVFFREDGQTKGIVPDVLNAISAITGDTFRYVRAPFPRAQEMFDHGEIDIEASVNPAWRTQAKVKGEYTVPYGESVNVYVFPGKESAFEISSYDDLIGKTLGIVRGYEYAGIGAYLADGRIRAAKVRDEDKLLKQLANKRVDVAAMHKPFVQYRMLKNPAFRHFVIGPVIDQCEIMMRFVPEKKDAIPRFNEAILQLRKSGKIDRIYARYR